MDLSFGVCAGGHPNVRSLYCCSAGNPRWIAFFSRQYCCLSGQRSHSIFANRIYRTFEALVEKKRGGPEGEEKDSKRKLRAKKLWNRYGIPGLSLLGPILVGSHLTALMGISFGASRQRILAWMGISLSIWTIISAVLAHLGFHFIIPEEQRNILTQWLK